MIWVFLFELAIWIFVPLIVATQVIIPLWRGRPTFPLLRRRPQVIDKIDRARSEVNDAELELVARRTEKEAEKLRGKVR